MSPREDIPPEVLPRAYFNQPVWKRIVVILAGPAVNLVIAFALLLGLYWSQGVVAQSHGQPIAAVAGPLQPPASAYLKPGDRIVSIDGHAHPSASQITESIASHRCAGVETSGCTGATPVRLVVQRNRRELTLRIRPRYDSTPKVKRMRLGFSFGDATERVGPIGAAGYSVREMWTVTSKTVSTIARLIEPQERKKLNSVVGAYKVTQQEFGYSAIDALFTLALISLSLAVINLFPFLPLDGGHVFWALAEKVRGRRIPFSVMERAGAVGFVLILIVFVIGLSNDISTLTGQGFATR